MTWICKKCGYRAAHEIEANECYCHQGIIDKFSGHKRGPRVRQSMRSNRAINALAKVGVSYMSQLYLISNKTLLHVPGIGDKTVKLIRNAINRYEKALRTSPQYRSQIKE